MNLDHDVLKADIAAGTGELGVQIRIEQSTHAGDGGRVVRERTLEVKLPKRSPCARASCVRA